MRGLDWLKLTYCCKRTLTGLSSEQQQPDKELCCWFHGSRLRRRRGLCLFRRQHLISSINLQELLHRHLYFCTMEIVMRKTRLHVTEKWLLLKLSLLVIFRTYLSITLDNKFLMTLCFWGNSCHFLLISRRWARIWQWKLKIGCGF